MANVPALTYDFESGLPAGTVMTAANSGFSAMSGTAQATTPTFTSDAYAGSLACRFLPAGGTIYAQEIFTADDLIWRGWYMKVAVAPASTAAVINWFNGATKIGDLRMVASGAGFTLQLRDNNSGVYTSPVLALNVWHRVTLKVQPGSATGHRLRIYSGAGLDGSTPSQDSLDQTATAAGQTAVTEFRWGSITATTVDWTIDRMSGDDAVEPVGADSTAPTISAVSHGTPGTTSATITWTTSEPATSKVGYSTTPGSYTTERPSPADSTADSTSHSVALTGLAEGTTYYYRVTSADASGNTANSAEGSFSTTSANTAPTANAGPDQIDVEPFATVTLDGSASTDPQGQALTYAWAQTAGTPTVTLAGTGATRTFTAPATMAGITLTFGLTVTDTGGLSSTQDTVTVQIKGHNLWVVAPNGVDRIPLRHHRVA